MTTSTSASPNPGSGATPRRPRWAREIVPASGLPSDVTDLLDQGVLVHGADGRVEQATAAAGRMLGVDAASLVGLDGLSLWGAALGSDGRPIPAQDNPLRVALVTGRPSTRLIRMPVPGEPARQLSVRAVPLPVLPENSDHDLEPTAPEAVAVLVTRPTTDDAIVDAARDRDHLLSVAQRMARLSVWRYTVGSVTVEWLDGDQRGMGIEGEHRGMEGYLDGIHPEDRPAHDGLLGALLGGQPSGEVDLRYRWQGGWRHWHMWAESVVDESGQVTALWGTTQEVTDRHEAADAIRHLQMTDSLTELPNRAQVHERLGNALVDGQNGFGVGLLVVDVDHFHAVNERYGHPVGDELLVEIGRRMGVLTSQLRTPGRLGGDEFGVVVERCMTTNVLELAYQLHRELAAPYLLPGAPEPITVGVSIGVTVCPTPSRASSSEVYRQAELAVAQAQSDGGGRVCLFDEHLRSRMLSRLDMETRLRVALADDEVFPLFQPVFTLGDSAAQDRVTSCEALARMSTDGELVSPVEFVELAEEAGLIVDLDVAVFTHAVRQVLVAPPAPGFGLAVNLSPLSLQVPGLVARLTQALHRAGVDGANLRVEITEGCLAEPTPTLVGQLRGLRELGARIGLDDFGTGYSALGYLRRFDLDFMKIDRSFVADVCTDRRSAAVVRAVVDLAHAHDLTVVAEGVETSDQLEALRDMRCDMVQGFHLGRPMPIEALFRLATPPR